MNIEKNREKWLTKVEKTLKLGGKSNCTFVNYKSNINKFLNYFENKDIKNLREDYIADYLLETYIASNKGSQTVNVATCSIKYFYSICFDRTLNKDLLPNCKNIKRIATIISKDDFLMVFNGETNIKYKCWLLLGFCSGLRVSEIATIRIENIYSSENKLKVIGKRKKERYTFIPNITIEFLRKYYKEKNITDKEGYLFKGSKSSDYMNCKSLINYFTGLKKKYSLRDDITTHSLRHSFATYFLMNGGDITDLKAMLGHSSLSTTGRYIHMSQDFKKLKGINYV